MKRILVALMLMLSSSAALRADEEPKLTVGLSQNKIFEGQSVIYSIRVENVENPPTPEVRGTDDFDVAFLGQSLRSQQITIINGVMQQASGAREFHYRLTPKKSGDLKIPAPLLKAGGKTLTGAAQRLIVQPPSAQDLVAVELTADRQAVYPTQPFTVTLSVLVKGLPPPMADRDPMSVQRRPPMLKIPWLPDQELPGGLSPQEDWQAWAKRFIDRDSVGFGINELVQESAFSVFGGGSALAFRPKAQSMARPDAQGHEATYFRYDFPRTFTAKQAGPITLGAVTLQGTFGNEVSEAGRLTGRDIYAASKPLAITVKDVPQEGRPDCYVGAIGQFQVSAALTPRQSKVGDPMTFTLTLSGSGSLAAAKPLDLGKVPALAARFKVYEATQNNEADAIHFVYSLRPLAEGNEPFPAVAVAYFDVDQERYVTIHSQPIPITIATAERLSGDQIVASPRAGGQTGKELEARREGIFANITDASMARDQSVRPLQWLAGLGGVVGTYFLLAAAAVVVRRRTQDKSGLRRRAAAGRARQRLRAAGVHGNAQQAAEAADCIQDALAGLVADVADLHDAGLTPKDVLRCLETWDVPQAVTARVCRLLEACDAARYAGAAASSGLRDEASPVLEAMIEVLRAQKRFR